MQLGQFSAVITVEGAPVSEYAVEYSADGLEATCWIASENDKNFRIEMKNTDASHQCSVSGRTSVDGIDCGGRLLFHRDGARGSKSTTGFRDSVATSANTRRPLAFSRQILTDDDEYLNTPISPDLGTIKVVFRLVKLHAGGEARKVEKYEPRILHERSKKAIGHSVQFGPEYRIHVHEKRRTTVIRTLATLVFRYRPLELLRAEGIAPPAERAAPQERAATPSDVLDLTTDVDDETEDPEEAQIKKLQLQLDTLKKKGKQVKREHSDVKMKKEVKTEGPIFAPGEVIDLT
ncbi:hypothetical protein DFH08DRAFT_875083 [Mycena albidolilacea]|uniref:DUF7918 domain-containing protein n=1 Tax=Mycena albidolilacea TaxID=1033008 RepID=A0AAD6ZUU8_9AGAR|nr:hypothetical protein DFH08DRAFT_875083 [Mycena albidolilacea]